MATNYPVKGDADKKIGAFFAPLQVSAQDTPNLTVKVRAGAFFNSLNELVEFPGGNSAALTIPTSGARWTIVGLNDSGSVTITSGVQGPSPSVPAIPSGILPLAAVYLTTTTTTITTPIITDIRPFLRSVDNVPSLSTELNNRPTFVDMNNSLDNKADADGTVEVNFALNKDFLSGTPTDNALLSVKRGEAADVSIRWNETSDAWEFTNDGITFNPILSTVGSFAPLVHTHTASDITDFNTSVDARVGTATIAQSQVTNLVSDLAAKASASTVTTHISDASIHFALPIAQSGVTGLVTDLAGKVSIAAPGTLTGNLTVQTLGNQPISIVSSDTGSSGLSIDRGVNPAARLEWDESLDAWLIGTTGSMDTVLTDAVVLTKADKVTGAVVGNFAGLDINGNLTDSGSAAASFQAADADLTAIAALTGTSGLLTTDGAGIWSVTATSSFQAADADLTAIAALTGTSGFLKTDGAGIWSVDVNTYSVTGHTHPQSDVTNLTTDLAAKYDEIVAVNGNFPAFGTLGATLSDSGVSAASFQPIDADLTAIAALTGTSGFLKTNGAGVWSVDIVTYAPTTRTLTAGTGLSGGGDLSADRTFDLANTTVVAAAYGSASAVPTFTVDAQGRLTAAADVPIAIAQAAVTNLTTDLALKYDEIVGVNGNLVSFATAGTTLADSGVAASTVALNTVTLTAGVGLAGGGDLSANRTFDIEAVKGTAAVTFGAIAANDVGDSSNTITVTGAVAGDVVSVGLPAVVPAGFTYNAFVSAADTVTVRAHGSATSGTGAGAADATINVIVFKYAGF